MNQGIRVAFFLFILNFKALEMAAQSTLREDHDYLWKDFLYLKELGLGDALNSLPSVVDLNETTYFQSLIYLAKNQSVRARDLINEHRRLPNHANPYETQVILGLVNHRRFNAAYGAFAEAIKINGERPEAYIEKVKLFSDAKNYLVGIDHANEAIRKFPNSLELYIYRGKLYLHEWLPKRAYKDFHKVLSSETTLSDFHMAQVHRGMASAHLALNNVFKAEIHVQESLILEPNHPIAMGIMTEIHFLQGNPQASARTFNSIVGTENQVKYYAMMGQVYETLGKKNEACKFYKASCQSTGPDTYGCQQAEKLGCD